MIVKGILNPVLFTGEYYKNNPEYDNFIQINISDDLYHDSERRQKPIKEQLEPSERRLTRNSSRRTRQSRTSTQPSRANSNLNWRNSKLRTSTLRTKKNSSTK